MKYGGYVYIVTNKRNNVLYIGVTSELYYRIQDIKTKFIPLHLLQKYNCCKLVYYEYYHRIEEAIAQEKKLKNWHRQWKINLIKNFNPSWKDLADELL
jgi:putative endonuclease